MTHRPRLGASLRPDPYDSGFFSALSQSSLESAEAVVPILTGLLRPASVLDVGCGGGEWLAAFRGHGVADVYGVDPYAVGAADLLIPQERVAAIDVREPFDLGRRFDLVLCLEVAEHLPGSAASTLIDSLTAHGDVVVFSAALPGQGGQGHLNEQWLEYWSELFGRRGFSGLDLLRPLIWERADVAWYYRQNMVIYSRVDLTERLDPGTAGARGLHGRVRSLVHPETLRYRVALTETPRGLRHALRSLYRAAAARLGLLKERPHPCPEYPPPS
jgi:SAM-dependent methyltransferase